MNILVRNIDDWVIKYFNYSMVVGPASGIIVLLIVISELNIPTFIGVLLIVLVLSVLPGYLLVPPYVHPDYTLGRAFSIKPYAYIAFVIWTIGIGPAILFFVKWQAIVQEKTIKADNLSK